MEIPKKLFVVVFSAPSGVTNHCNNHNVGIYSTRDTACMAAEMMGRHHSTADIDYWVDEVEFCEAWKE